MTASLRFPISLLILVGIFLPSADARAAGCALNKNTAELKLVERNIATLEKMLTGPEKTKIIEDMRSKVASLKARGGAFPDRAAPLEKECEGFVKENKALKALKEERDKKLAAIQAKIEANKAEYERVIGPRKQALAAELASIHAMGCPFDGSKVKKEVYDRCIGPEDAYLGRKRALNNDAKVYHERQRQFMMQKREVSVPYAERLKKGRERYRTYKEKVDRYNADFGRWKGELRQVWGETNQLFMQARKARQKMPARLKGGEIGKLSGPLDKGSSGRSPGSGKLPAASRMGGEGGAKGQARAAAKTGKQGVAAGSASEASFQAGRVFDRGDVNVSGSAGAVDARGVQPRKVPEAIRRDPRWQALDQKEMICRTEQKKVQQKIDSIKQKLQAGEGNKGQLQVDLVHARDEMSKLESQVNMVKVEKESFLITIEEKPAASAESSGEQQGTGK